MEEAILELIELAKNTAPELWRIALLQVKAEVIQRYIIIFISVISSVTLNIKTKRIRALPSSEKSDLEETIEGLDYIFLVALAIVTIITLISLMKMTINPEYYAIKELIWMVK
jgi:hypothetical protein